MSETKAKAVRPSAEIIEEMARDFASHGKPDFVLERDVSYAGNLQPAANYSYYFSEEEGERYHCPLCGGTTLPKKIPYGSPARNAWVRLKHPEVWNLAPKIAPEDLGKMTPEQLIAAGQQLEQVTEDFDRGLYAKAIRGKVAKAKLQKTKEAGRDRRTAARIQNGKTFMLELYALLGTREEAWDELDGLREDNVELYREIIGDDRPVPDGTKAHWWEEIDEEDREAARAIYAERPEAERKRQAAERRARKVRP